MKIGFASPRSSTIVPSFKFNDWLMPAPKNSQRVKRDMAYSESNTYGFENPAFSVSLRMLPKLRFVNFPMVGNAGASLLNCRTVSEEMVLQSSDLSKLLFELQCSHSVTAVASIDQMIVCTTVIVFLVSVLFS